MAQVTIRDNRGTILRAEERNGDMFAAIDAVMDKLYRQIERYRGKKKRKHRGSGASIDEFAYAEEPLPLSDTAVDDERQSIVRRKIFSLYPMSPEEAIDQMELLGHDFFIFFNTEEEAINVLYTRRDGNYGLLLPEFD